MKYYEIERFESNILIGRYIQTKEELKNVLEEILMDENEIGDNWLIEIVEMSEEEYNDLPEFTGY